MPKSRFFRVAVSGATTDGRTIDPKWLEEAAATYNRETYAARVNMEHIRGVTAEPPFQSLGDVLSLKTEEITLDIGGKQEKRLALFAEIEALDPLVAMNRKGQKLYSSAEIAPNFANSGKAYLVGLAVTDSPASLGTEMLTFRTKLDGSSPLRLDGANQFTPGLETAIELVDEPAANPDPTGVFASIKKFFDGIAAPAAPAAPAVTPPAQDPPAGDPPALQGDAQFAALAGVVGQLTATVQGFVTQSQADTAALRAEIDKLKGTVETTPASGFTARPPATGSVTGERTDC